MTDNVLEELRKLREQESSLVEQAKEQAIDQAEAAVRLLNELGFDYRFIYHAEGRSKKKKTARKRGVNSDGPCKICGFKTAPLHDARHHRSQGEDKTPFTGAELQEKGFAKIAESVERQSIGNGAGSPFELDQQE